MKGKEFLFSLNTVELLEFFGNNIFVYYLWKHNTTKICFELWLSLVCDPRDELNTYAVVTIVSSSELVLESFATIPGFYR